MGCTGFGNRGGGIVIKAKSLIIAFLISFVVATLFVSAESSETVYDPWSDVYWDRDVDVGDQRNSS